MKPTLPLTLAAACSTLALGCTARRAPHHPATPPSTATATAPRPAAATGLRVPVVVQVDRGALAAEVEGVDGWQPVTGPLVGVRALTAGRHGAIVSLGDGDAAGRLWLRAGARVRFAHDDRGVRVTLEAGEARLRRGPAALPVAVVVGAAATPVEGDVLLARGERAVAVAATAIAPERADWSFALERASDGAGVGRLDAAGEHGPREALELRRVSVRVTTAGDHALTEIEHVFFNPSAEVREGTFRFPVPDRAIVTGLAMEIHGALMEGEIVEREQARQIYEDIVDRMQDPALLEWEAGQWFKLRVFPIEAQAEKRVILRYTAPLARTAAGLAYDFTLVRPRPEGADARTAATTAPIGDLAIVVDGTAAFHEAALTRDLDLSLPVVAAAPAVVREVRPEATYTAVRVDAQAALAGVAAPAPHDRKLAIIVDTSRSALESRALARELLGTTLAGLGPRDRFALLASDVAVTAAPGGFVTAGPAELAAATAFLDGIEPDGASDLGAALTAAAALHPTEVIYLGDGIASWGVRDPAALTAAATAIGAPVHAGLLGKGAASGLWAELTAATGGRAMTVRRAVDGDRFALAVNALGGVRRLRNARLTTTTGVSYPTTGTTLFDGDSLTALIRTPAGEPAPTTVTLTGDVDGRPVHQQVALAAAVDVRGVAQRWGVQHLAALEAADTPREELVAASQELGVLSRVTSLLVLESDESYRAHQIERRKAEEQERLAAAPTITGGDLDSLDAPEASLSPDEIQPGDPEIKIPAPRDARLVVVSFPWGETKVAAWDVDQGAWMVRFLVDKDTPDGVYQARVAITHADGRIELVTLPYTVDTRAPALELSATAVAGGYRLDARQVAEVGGARRKDADRVEVALPDGTLLALDRTGRTTFSAVWRTAPLAAPVTLRVVVRDRALNQATLALTVR